MFSISVSPVSPNTIRLFTDHCRSIPTGDGEQAHHGYWAFGTKSVRAQVRVSDSQRQQGLTLVIMKVPRLD